MATTTHKTFESTGQQAREGAKQVMDTAKDTAANAGKKFGEVASNAGQKISDMASGAGQKFSEMAASASEKVGEVATSAGHRAEDAAASVGTGMKSLAGTIRERAPSQGMLGNAASAVASGLEEGGRYLEENRLSGIGEDVLNIIRRNPFPAVMVGIGIGFLLARAIRR